MRRVAQPRRSDRLGKLRAAARRRRSARLLGAGGVGLGRGGATAATSAAGSTAAFAARSAAAAVVSQEPKRRCPARRRRVAAASGARLGGREEAAARSTSPSRRFPERRLAPPMAGALGARRGRRLRRGGALSAEPSSVGRTSGSVAASAWPAGRDLADVAARAACAANGSAAMMSDAASAAARSARRRLLRKLALAPRLRRPALVVRRRPLPGGGARRATRGGKEIVVDRRLRLGRRRRRCRSASAANGRVSRPLRAPDMNSVLELGAPVRAELERRVGARLEREIASVVGLFGSGREGFGAAAGRPLQKLARGQAAEQAGRRLIRQPRRVRRPASAAPARARPLISALPACAADAWRFGRTPLRGAAAASRSRKAMRLTTASSVSCTASIASRVFRSVASVELFSTVTSSDSARARPATIAIFASAARLSPSAATSRLVEPLLDRLQARLDMRERQRPWLGSSRSRAIRSIWPRGRRRWPAHPAASAPAA